MIHRHRRVMDKVRKAIPKKEMFDHQKKFTRFPRKLVISTRSCKNRFKVHVYLIS